MSNDQQSVQAQGEPMGRRKVKEEVRIQLAIVSAAARGATVEQMIAALDALMPDGNTHQVPAFFSDEDKQNT